MKELVLFLHNDQKITSISQLQDERLEELSDMEYKKKIMKLFIDNENDWKKSRNSRITSSQKQIQ